MLLSKRKGEGGINIYCQNVENYMSNITGQNDFLTQSNITSHLAKSH